MVIDNYFASREISNRLSVNHQGCMVIEMKLQTQQAQRSLAQASLLACTRAKNVP